MFNSVDVIIPTYNSAKYLSDAIRSVLKQGKYVNKLIVVDDGSTDNTKEIVTSFASRNSNILYIKQRNKGLSGARNTGINQAKAPYIAFLDADDVWQKDKLKLQLDKFKNSKFPSLGLVYCEYFDINEQGRKLLNYGSFRLHKEIKGRVTTQMQECNYATGSGSGVLIRRACFSRVGMFDVRLKACEDWDMWMRIAKYYDFDYVNKPLVSLRRHPKSMQAQRRHMTINTAVLLAKMLMNRIVIKPDLIRDNKRDILRYLIEHPWDVGFYHAIAKGTGRNQDYFIVWHSASEFLSDLKWTLYVQLRDVLNHLARPIVLHVIPPFKTYVIKPVKKMIKENQRQ